MKTNDMKAGSVKTISKSATMRSMEYALAKGPTSATITPTATASASFDDDGDGVVWWGDVSHKMDGHVRRSGPKLSDIEYIAGRGQWGHKMEFILSCIGLSVGMGNVWRFPYLAYENGGAAFLLAYVVLQFLVGKPMYFLELSISQFSGKGPTKVWDMNPAAKGIGFSMCMISFNIAIYYTVVISYALFFFFSCMQPTLPWTECKPEWERDDGCVGIRQPYPSACTSDIDAMETLGKCTCTGNATLDTAFSYSCTQKIHNATTAAELFFYKEVIQRSVGVEPENMGTPVPMLVMYLVLTWLVVIFCVMRGIKSTGKVVYFTATFPYIILMALLIRVSFLDGAYEGAKYFLVPEWEKLLDLKVWLAAAGQMFFSLSITLGGIIMYGSYNGFYNNVYYDTILIATMDLVSSLIGGLVVFSTFGTMAKTLGTTVDKVATGGYGLAFVVYPEALSTMSPAHLWSLLFFFMLFTLGLDSEFALFETILTCVSDEYPKLRPYKSYMCVFLGVVLFLFGLPCVCPGGDFVVAIMDHYGADFSVIFIALCEVIAVCWVYGMKRYSNDMEYMLGKRPHGWSYWVFCSTIICPCILTLLFTYRMVKYKPPHYPTGEPFPPLAQSIGWCICALVLSPIPLWFFFRLFQSYRTSSITTLEQRKEFLFAPNRHWMPNDGRSLNPTRVSSSINQ